MVGGKRRDLDKLPGTGDVEHFEIWKIPDLQFETFFPPGLSVGWLVGFVCLRSKTVTDLQKPSPETKNES